MEKKKEYKEIELLKKAKLRTYTVDTFKRYWTYEDDYASKKARVVNAAYIVIYGLWHKRLLARVFYFEEVMKYKKITRKLFEVQRQVAGISMKITQRVYNSTFAGFKVWTGRDEKGWMISNINSYQLYGIRDNWSGRDIISFYEFNDSFKYLNKSIHKYCAYNLFPAEDKEYNHMFEYLLKYEKHPQLEMLLKMGLSNLTYDLTPIRWSKKGISMLGITKQELHYLQSGINLRAYRKVREECLKYKFSVKEAKMAYDLKKSKCQLELSAKLIRYLIAQKIDAGIYVDHIRMKEELGLPNENKYLFPKNFGAMHEELSNRIKAKKSEEMAEKMLEITKKASKLCISDNLYKIVVLSTPDDLIEEGKQMHHCVGSYVERVARGDCLIYSVRKKENPSKPLATIEVRNKKVIQVRAPHNGVPDKDISNFVRKWENKFRLNGW